MLFNSAAFAIFFPIVVLLYFAVDARWRWALLLVASCIFYMAAIPVYILILAFTIATDYVAGLAIDRSQSHWRKVWLGASIAANLGMLFFFKYFDFFIDASSPLARHLGLPVPAHLNLILPIGLSFHTFQALSYTVEVYRGRVPPERHLGIFALYVLFFPQLVAGPIERPAHLLPQFRQLHRFDAQRATDGLRLMALGLFKKVVIADRLALVVSPVYGVPTNYAGPHFVVAAMAFSYQIYCDFSGYTDIARGAARVLGFELVRNFDSPYASSSVREFWRRWHISLSTWFRDYVYIPLGGNRHGTARRNVNLLLTFLLSGLWHGAQWTFVIWGGIHGLLVLASLTNTELRARATQWIGLARLPRLHEAIRTALTFTLVTYAWIWFRARHLSDAIYISTHLFAGWHLSTLRQIPTAVAVGRNSLVVIACSVGFLECLQYYRRRQPIGPRLDALPVWGRWAIYYATVSAIALFGVLNDAKFIYFQF